MGACTIVSRQAGRHLGWRTSHTVGEGERGATKTHRGRLGRDVPAQGDRKREYLGPGPHGTPLAKQRLAARRHWIQRRKVAPRCLRVSTRRSRLTADCSGLCHPSRARRRRARAPEGGDLGRPVMLSGPVSLPRPGSVCISTGKTQSRWQWLRVRASSPVADSSRKAPPLSARPRTPRRPSPQSSSR